MAVIGFRSTLAAVGALALAACHAAPLQKRALPAHPRVVSMNPCIDAILAQVADDDQIVSISHYSQDPKATSVDLAWARRFPANTETAEEVIAEKPDLVLVGSHVAKPTIAAIERDGVATVPVDVPMTIAESLDQIRTVARTVGHPERGDRLVARIEAALATAAPRPGTRPIGALIWQGGGLVPGKGTLADELLTRTGFTDLSAAYGLKQWDVLPAELMLARPPTIIFTPTQTGRQRLQSGVYARLARTATIEDFPFHLLQCAGPSLIDAATTLAAARRRYEART